jgi:hypothetical protein
MGLKLWIQESVQEDEMGTDSQVINDGSMRLLAEVDITSTSVDYYFCATT